MKIEDNLYNKTAYLFDLDPRPLLKDDISFYIRQAALCGGDILDIGAGSGRIAIPLARAGFRVWALDLSPAMMAQLLQKIPRLPVEEAARIHPVYGDMRDFTLDRKFSLVIIPFRGFQALVEDEDRGRCLSAIHRSLEDNGVLIVTFFKTPPDILESWGDGGLREVFDWEAPLPDGGVVRRYHVKKRVNPNKQVIYADQIFYIEQRDGGVERLTEEAYIRYDDEANIRALLKSRGLDILAEWGYYDDRPLGEGTEMIFLCRKSL